MEVPSENFTSRAKSIHEEHQRVVNCPSSTPSYASNNKLAANLSADAEEFIRDLIETLEVAYKTACKAGLKSIKLTISDTSPYSSFLPAGYAASYVSLIKLSQISHKIPTGTIEFWQRFLSCWGYLMPFVDWDVLCRIPYLMSSMLAELPVEMHNHIVIYICYNILPVLVADKSDYRDNVIQLSLSAVIMNIFQYAYNSPYHFLLIERLMSLKLNVVRELLCIIAYGTTRARLLSIKLLFFYFPNLNMSLDDGDNNVPIGNLELPRCQHKDCTGHNTWACNVCYDVQVSLTFSKQNMAPIYVCDMCAYRIRKKNKNIIFHPTLYPMDIDDNLCHNDTCRNTGVVICLSIECARRHDNRPVRYCETCDARIHNELTKMEECEYVMGDNVHNRYSCLKDAWSMDDVTQMYLIEAIVSLLKEARPTTPEISKDLTDIQAKAALFNIPIEGYELTVDERQLLGRYGVTLLVGLCKPVENTAPETISRLLSILFHWFHVTAYSFDDSAKCTLERLKTDYVCMWLADVRESHFSIFAESLLPYPAHHARVGGHWEVHTSRTCHLKNGLNRLFCLVPYEVITQELWDYVMPHWMNAIAFAVPEKYYRDFKMSLSKMLDPDMSSLSFDVKRIYQFIGNRFKRTSAQVQLQALRWMQALTIVEVSIPLHILFTFFEDGINALTLTDDDNNDNSPSTISRIEHCYDDCLLTEEDEMAIYSQSVDSSSHSKIQLNLNCCVLMLDVLLKQMECRQVERYMGVHSVTAQDIASLLKKVLSANWFTKHECHKLCTMCELRASWLQLSVLLIEYVVPEKLAYPPDPPLEEATTDVEKESKKNTTDSDKKEQKGEGSSTTPVMELNSFQFLAPVETVVEQWNLPIPPTKIPTIARTINTQDVEIDPFGELIKDTDDGLIDDSDCECNADELWQTSVGKFRFSLNQLSPQLQYFYKLLQEISKSEDADVTYSMLQCLYLLILHGDILSKCLKDHKGFVIWCQENLLIRTMWEKCDGEHSHICQVCVPILLHCVSLPSGADVLWKVLQQDFHSLDWRVRFIAVGRVTMMARFMDSTPLREHDALQEVLTNAFCYLVTCMDDDNALVAQRATLYLGTIHDYAMKCVIMCLESQFDRRIVDRPMVLQALYQLHNTLTDRKVLTWQFFLNRFDTLYLEAQLNFEKSGEVPYFKDLQNMDHSNSAFVIKLRKAQEALEDYSQGSDSTLAKTLSASFGMKWPYKRTMSAPASMLSRQDSKLDKDRVYSRQFSAPVLKRRSSRLALDGHGQGLQTWSYSNHEESMIIGTYSTLHRIIAFEEMDKQTMHLLIFLLMQFMSRSDQCTLQTDEKQPMKMEGIVLRHVFLLLGYNHNERAFYLSPHVIRSLAVFNAFLSNLPQLLDQNHSIGSFIVPTSLLLLHYSPCTSSHSSFDTNPTYSLWNLQSHVRRYWLLALLVFLYKYNYKKSHTQVVPLMKIVLNTLNRHYHVCRRIPATLVMNNMQPQSIIINNNNNDSNVNVNETPPQSPGNITAGPSSSFKAKRSATSMETHWEEDARNHCLLDDDGGGKSKENQNTKNVGISNGGARPKWYLGSEDCDQKDEEKQQLLLTSPDSPLSRMNLGSMDEETEKFINDFVHSDYTVELALPQPERLLPIGQPSNVIAQHVASVLQLHNLSKELKEDTDETSTTSPRRLMKQVALESPSSDDVFIKKANLIAKSHHENSSSKSTSDIEDHYYWIKALDRMDGMDEELQQLCHADSTLKHSAYTISYDCIEQRCIECGMVKEEYSSEEISLCIIVLGTFIHREPALAVPMLHSILSIVVKISIKPFYSWQSENKSYLPSNAVSVARQFLRVVLHQLAPNGLFIQLFQTPIKENERMNFFKSLVQVLIDFKELCPSTPLVNLLEILNCKKSLGMNKMRYILPNMHIYLECLLTETSNISWAPLLTQLESFLRRMSLMVNTLHSSTVNSLMANIVIILKIPSIVLYKGVLEPFSKIVSHGLQKVDSINDEMLLQMCHYSYRIFTREREKVMLTRVAVDCFIQALKMKIVLPQTNVISILRLILNDYGLSLTLEAVEEIEGDCGRANTVIVSNTGAVEVTRQYFSDMLDFVSDANALTKLKNTYKDECVGDLSERSLWCCLKGALCQYIAVELTRSCGRDNRPFNRHFPWLYATSATQQTNRDFNDCIGHVRLLSWLLIGALENTFASGSLCQPVPQEVSCYIVDHLQTVLATFPDSSAHVGSHMSSVFYTFTLCQLWTMYLEESARSHTTNSEQYVLTQSILFDFWTKIMPNVLQLCDRSKSIADMVNIHFVYVLESLLKCKSNCINKLLPIWCPAFSSNSIHLPKQLQARLQNCRNDISPSMYIFPSTSTIQLNLLRQLRFKMSQIELRSSHSPELYSV